MYEWFRNKERASIVYWGILCKKNVKLYKYINDVNERIESKGIPNFIAMVESWIRIGYKIKDREWLIRKNNAIRKISKMGRKISYR